MISRTLKKTPLLLALIASALGAAGAAEAQQLTESDCSTLRGDAATACRAALSDDAPVNVFLRLGELLVGDRNLMLAVKVYRRGVRLHGDSSELKAKLTVAESGLDEAQWMELRRQEVAEMSDSALKGEVFKCTRLAKSAPQTALRACDLALELMPKDAGLLESRGDALQTMGNNTEAYLAYDAAARQAPSPELKDKLTALAAYKPQPKPEPKPEPVVTAKAEPAESEQQQEEAARAAEEAARAAEQAAAEEAARRAAEQAAAEEAARRAAEQAAAEEAARRAAEQAVAEEAARRAAEQAAAEEAARAAAQAAADRIASLRAVVNDRGRGLDERLEARNTLLNLARQEGG